MYTGMKCIGAKVHILSRIATREFKECTTIRQQYRSWPIFVRQKP